MYWQTANRRQTATVEQTQNAEDAESESQGKEYFIEQIAQGLKLSRSDIEAELSEVSVSTLKALAVEMGAADAEVQGNAAEYPGGELGVDSGNDPSLSTNDGGESNPAAYPDGEL